MSMWSCYSFYFYFSVKKRGKNGAIPDDLVDAPQEGITLKTYNQSVESLEHEANP